jgi:hypothetical protein
MRLTNEMNFPHPVLADWRTDFTSGEFSVEISYQENKTDNQLNLHIETILECEDIEGLIENGKAQLGCFVSCASTGYRRLIEVGRPAHTYKFKPGDLLDAVIIRPVVWVTEAISEWCPSDLHPEYFGSHRIRRGEIIAMADEQVIQVGRANLPSLETIFQLQVDDTLPDGEFGVDMDAEKITILAPRDTYDLIETLRASGATSASVIMNALYVPCVMRVLSQVATDDGEGNFAEFESRRWVTAFQRRCEKLDIKHREAEVLGNAQNLLEYPFSTLTAVTGES